MGAAVSLVAESGKIEGPSPRPYLRVVVKSKWSKCDSLAFRNILPQLARPEPAHIQVILEKRVDRVDRSVFLLGSLDDFVDPFDGRVRGIPSIAARDDKVLFRSANQNLFRSIELVKDKATKEPVSPFGVTNDLSKAINTKLRQGGVSTFVHWNVIHVVPPLVITEAELREGLAIIDKVLDYVDTQI